LGEVFEPDWKALCSPGAGRAVKHTGAGRTARVAAPISREMPCGQHIPIAADDFPSTARAVGATSLLVMHIARVGIAQAVFHRDPARQRQRFGRCARTIGLFPIRMEGGEVDLDFNSQNHSYSLDSLFELAVSSILTL